MGANFFKAVLEAERAAANNGITIFLLYQKGRDSCIFQA
jgi:hypothetical protein